MCHSTTAFYLVILYLDVDEIPQELWSANAADSTSAVTDSTGISNGGGENCSIQRIDIDSYNELAARLSASERRENLVMSSLDNALSDLSKMR